MNKLIRFYNQNRTIFWIIVLCIIAIIALIQTLNNNYKKNSSSVENNTTTYNNRKTQEPAYSGSTIKEETKEVATTIIDTFINYCKTNEIEKAYDLISDECKIIIFDNDINKFKENYYTILKGNETYDIKLWVSSNARYTYKIEFMEDILSTGNTLNLNITDYITVIKENGEYKLNIKNYIGKEEVNKNTTKDKVTVNVIERYMYMDYEIYRLEIKNNTNKSIIIDDKKEIETVYMEDQNGAKYVAFLNENTKQSLTVKSGMTEKIDIKFNKSYSPTYKIKGMTLSKFIFDTKNIEEKQEIYIKF